MKRRKKTEKTKEIHEARRRREERKKEGRKKGGKEDKGKEERRETCHAAISRAPMVFSPKLISRCCQVDIRG